MVHFCITEFYAYTLVTDASWEWLEQLKNMKQISKHVQSQLSNVAQVHPEPRTVLTCQCIATEPLGLSLHTGMLAAQPWLVWVVGWGLQGYMKQAFKAFYKKHKKAKFCYYSSVVWACSGHSHDACLDRDLGSFEARSKHWVFNVPRVVPKQHLWWICGGGGCCH